MLKTKSKCGYVIYKVTLTECVAITGGYGMCDACNKPDKELYLIPVLNSAYCEKCFKEWDERAIYYEEDLDFQASYIKYFERMANTKDIKIKEI